MSQPRYKEKESKQEVDSNLGLATQLVSDLKSIVKQGKTKMDCYMAEKVWRLETSRQIDALIHNTNTDLKENLDLKHNRSHSRMFALKRAKYLEEDIFTYFYPFCLVNCTLGAVFLLRKSGGLIMTIGTVATIEYVYFLFSFPVEAWHFHKRALSTDKPYAQFLRDTYISKFDNHKASVYKRINQREAEKYSRLKDELQL